MHVQDILHRAFAEGWTVPVRSHNMPKRALEAFSLSTAWRMEEAQLLLYGVQRSPNACRFNSTGNGVPYLLSLPLFEVVPERYDIALFKECHVMMSLNAISEAGRRLMITLMFFIFVSRIRP